jgi:hypothetical protein
MYQTFHHINLISNIRFLSSDVGTDPDPVDRVLFELVGSGSDVIFLD